MKICPKCPQSPLKEAKVKDTLVRIDYCKACKGIWFDRFELEKLMEHALWDFRPPMGADKTAWLCPKCEKNLVTFPYPHTDIPVEMCKSCSGIWLDKHELKTIEAARKALRESGEPDAAQKAGLFDKIFDTVFAGLKI